MKYRIGNIVCLNDGRSVYIFSIDEKKKKYQVTDTNAEDNGDLFMVSEDEIFMLLI